ncbi:MAG: hypothetical protein ACI311_00990 [Bacilli bacterium]
MRKSTIPLLIATSIALLPSCGSSKIVPLERQLGIKEPIKLESFSDLNLMISQKQSFLLTTYSTTCFCSIDFYNNILNPIVEEYSIVVYKISEKEFAKMAGLSFTPSTPEIITYKDGEIIAHIDAYSKWNNEVKNKDKVVNYISKYFYIKSPMITCTKEEIEELIKTNQDILIYFKLKTCPDCRQFEEMFLNSYLMNKNNSSKTIYAIETSLYRDENDSSLWENFTSDFQLSYVSNNEQGYLNGKVPTIQYYSGGQLQKTCVIYNDQYTQNEDSSITITSGYYNEFNGQTFKNKDEYRSKTLDFYKNKFLELIDVVYQ